MLVRDLRTGQLVDVPDRLMASPAMGGVDGWGVYGSLPRASGVHGLGAYHAAPSQIVYDGLGNPVGILPFLAALKPLAAKLIPTLATKAGGLITKLLPQITSALPMLTGGGAVPQAMPVQTAMPGAEAMVGPVPPMSQMMPGQMMPPSMPGQMMSPPIPGQAMPPSVPGPMSIPGPMIPSAAGSEASTLPPPSMPSASAPGASSTAPQEEVVVAPMRVRTRDGTAVVPVRVRRRRRTRGRRLVRIMPRVMQSVRLPSPEMRSAPGPLASQGTVQGWDAFGGWRSY